MKSLFKDFLKIKSITITILITLITITTSCMDDNDDVILSEDIQNIDFSKGLIFGKINQENCSSSTSSQCINVYQFFEDHMYIATNTTVPVDGQWQFDMCYLEASESRSHLIASKGIYNLPRQLRDVNTSNINTFLDNNAGINVYVFEYFTYSGTQKTLQFTNKTNENYEETLTDYLSYLIETSDLIPSFRETADCN